MYSDRTKGRGRSTYVRRKVYYIYVYVVRTEGRGGKARGLFAHTRTRQDTKILQLRAAEKATALTLGPAAAANEVVYGYIVERPAKDFRK